MAMLNTADTCECRSMTCNAIGTTPFSRNSFAVGRGTGTSANSMPSRRARSARAADVTSILSSFFFGELESSSQRRRQPSNWHAAECGALRIRSTKATRSILLNGAVSSLAESRASSAPTSSNDSREPLRAMFERVVEISAMGGLFLPAATQLRNHAACECAATPMIVVAPEEAHHLRMRPVSTQRVAPWTMRARHRNEEIEGFGDFLLEER
eukprot:scaffold155363_cov35-Tisochrysis_lutea.AAC.3